MSLVTALSVGAAPQSAVSLDKYKAAFGTMIDRLKDEAAAEIESRFSLILQNANKPGFDINALLYEAETLKIDFIDFFKGQKEATNYPFTPTDSLDRSVFKFNLDKIKSLIIKLMQLKLEEYRKESLAAKKPEDIKQTFKKVSDFIDRFKRII